MTIQEEAKKYWEQHKASNVVAFRIFDKRIQEVMFEMDELCIPQHVIVTVLYAWEKFSEEGLDNKALELIKAFGDLLVEDMEIAVKKIELEERAKSNGQSKEKKTIGG